MSKCYNVDRFIKKKTDWIYSSIFIIHIQICTHNIKVQHDVHDCIVYSSSNIACPW